MIFRRGRHRATQFSITVADLLREHSEVTAVDEPGGGITLYLNRRKAGQTLYPPIHCCSPGSVANA